MRKPRILITGIYIARSFVLAAFCCVSCLTAAPASEYIRVSPDGWHFETARTHKRFIPFGGVYFDPVTYEDKPFPRFLLIEKFDEARTDRHFAQIAGIGANIVRISTSVRTFSPEYRKIDTKAFKKLDRIIFLARKHGLRVVLDPFGGWEGLPDWLPWLPGGLMNEKMMQGLEFLFSEFAQRYRNEPVVFSYLIADEPTFPWTAGSMPSRFGEYIRSLYGSEEGLRRSWNDYPRNEERWDRILPPRDENAPASRRLYDYQMFREDLEAQFVRRMAKAIRAKDTKHLISLATIQWEAPMRFGDRQAPANEMTKPSGYFPFNPRKIGKYLDYMDTHGYNWWDDKSPEYIQGLGRYFLYPGKPTVLGEYEFNPKVVEYTRNTFSGYMAWAFFPVPDQPFQFLFDSNEQLTGNGRRFAETAKRIAAGEIAFERAEDAAVVRADGLTCLTDPRSMIDVYRQYVEKCGTAQPVGLQMKEE